MGTPHVGSTKADWITPLTRLSNILRKTNTELVQVLKPGSEMLANLQQEFHTMLNDRSRNQQKNLEIFCFYEELPVTGIGKVAYQSFPNEHSRVTANQVLLDRA
jgi:protein SERAC1